MRMCQFIGVFTTKLNIPHILISIIIAGFFFQAFLHDTDVI